MNHQEKRKRRRFSEPFKRDAVNLIVVEGYSVSAAARAFGVDNRVLRTWPDKFAAEIPACGEEPRVEQLKDEVKRLRKQLREAERANEILKKSNGVFREGVAVCHRCSAKLAPQR